MTEYAPGSHEYLRTYTVVFPERQNDFSEKDPWNSWIGQYISSWIANKMVGLKSC